MSIGNSGVAVRSREERMAKGMGKGKGLVESW